MRITRIVATCVLGLAAFGVAAQDSYPSKPVQVIVPFPPGGVAELNARPATDVLSRVLKQPFVLVNRPGAGGATGNAQVANATPDGYTLLAGLASMVTIPPAERLAGRKPTYELDQFEPIALISNDPLVVIVRTESPLKNIQDLIADAKARPGKQSYASSGIYGNIHVAVEMLAHSGKLEFLHAPYSGGGPANTAVLAGQVDFTLAGPSSAGSFIKGGKARALAVTSNERIKLLPDVPTLKELGYDVDYTIWAGLFAPKGTPPAVMKRLRDAMRQAPQDETFRTMMDRINTPIDYRDGPEFQKLIDFDAKRLAEVINRIGRLEQTK